MKLWRILSTRCSQDSQDPLDVFDLDWFILCTSVHVQSALWRRSPAVRENHRQTHCVDGFGSYEQEQEPASVTLPKRCQSWAQLHAPLHHRTDYQSGRWDGATQGNFKRTQDFNWDERSTIVCLLDVSAPSYSWTESSTVLPEHGRHLDAVSFFFKII